MQIIHHPTTLGCVCKVTKKMPIANKNCKINLFLTAKPSASEAHFLSTIFHHPDPTPKRHPFWAKNRPFLVIMLIIIKLSQNTLNTITI